MDTEQSSCMISAVGSVPDKITAQRSASTPQTSAMRIMKVFYSDYWKFTCMELRVINIF